MNERRDVFVNVDWLAVVFLAIVIHLGLLIMKKLVFDL